MTRGQRNRLIFVVVLLVAVIGIVIYLRSRDNQAPAVSDGGGTTADALSQPAGKPHPVSQVYKGCPASGDGGDPVLNTLKNRIDEAQWSPTTVAGLLALTWPKGVEHQPHFKWSAADKEAIARYEGTPVQAEGYILDAKKMSPESCNCHSVTEVDFHIWFADDPNKTRKESIVIEASPRVRAFHPTWTVTNLGKIARNHTKVRISGWLMMDPEHPDQVGRTRASIWEIHPVMQIETYTNGQWVPLDNGTTGVRSQQAAVQTLPPLTPQSTVTEPTTNTEQVQDNHSIQITGIFYDGVKKNEPDEFVEITNKGTRPVDITDWELEDTTGQIYFKWESYVMQPRQVIRVYTNEIHPESGGFSYQSGRALWNNSGDIAELFDSDKQLISRYAYGNKK